MRVPWLFICAILGAGLGFLFAPAVFVNSDAAATERAMRISGLFPVGGAMLGVLVGVVVDFVERRKKG